MTLILRIAATIAFAAIPTAAFAQNAAPEDAHRHGEQGAPADQNAPVQADPQHPADDEAACPCPHCRKMMQMMMEHMGHGAERAQPSNEGAAQHNGH